MSRRTDGFLKKMKRRGLVLLAFCLLAVSVSVSAAEDTEEAQTRQAQVGQIVKEAQAEAAKQSETAEQPESGETAGKTVSFADLQGMTGAVKDGTVFDQVLTDLVGDPTIAYYKTMADACIALQQGKVDYCLVIREQYSAIAEEYEDLTLVPQLSAPCGEIGFIFAKTETGDALRGEMDAYLADLKKSGELEQLKNVWFTPGEKKTVEIPKQGSGGILSVATAAASPPFIYLEGDSLNGYEVDLLVGFAREYGYGLQFEIMDMSGILPSVDSGKTDLAANCLRITDERKQEVNFSEATANPEYTILMRKETAASFAGIVTEETGNQKGFLEKVASSFQKTFLVEQRWKLILKGCAVTLLLTFFSAAMGILLGFQFYKLMACKNRAARKLIGIFNSIMGGMPMVVLLMIFYYIIFGSIAIPAFLVAVIAFGLNFASTVSEIYYNCIQSIDIGQTEAALALGYTDRQAFRRFIFPQARLRALPLVRGQIVALLKGTAIVGFISVQDLTKMGDLIRSRTYEAFFPLLAIAVIYFLFAWLIRLVVARMQAGWDPVRRRKKRLARAARSKDRS